MAENQNAAEQASTLNDERATRLAKRAALFEAGQNPYPEHSEIEDYVADIEAKYAELADGEDTEDVVKIGGRVVAKRGQGKIMFIVVRDATAEIQLFCRINDMDEAAWNTLKALDLGDILGVTGVVVRTKPPRARNCSPRPFARCPRSSMASPTRRPAIVSAMST